MRRKLINPGQALSIRAPRLDSSRGSWIRYESAVNPAAGSGRGTRIEMAMGRSPWPVKPVGCITLHSPCTSGRSGPGWTSTTTKNIAGIMPVAIQRIYANQLNMRTVAGVEAHPENHSCPMRCFEF